MSLSTYGAVEFLESGSDRWWTACRPIFYGDTDLAYVLGDPWDPYGDDRDGPNPPVPLRGVAPDLSILVEGERRKRSEGRWKASTWLTLDEVGLVSAAYYNYRGRASREIVAIEEYMRAFRAARPNTEVRLIVWWT